MKRPTMPVLICYMSIVLANAAAGYAQAHGVPWAFMFGWGISAIVMALFEVVRVIEEKGKQP